MDTEKQLELDKRYIRMASIWAEKLLLPAP